MTTTLNAMGTVFKTHKKHLVIGVTGVLISLCAILAIREAIHNPDVALLSGGHGAAWIRFREPFELRARGPQKTLTLFRTRFEINENRVSAILYLRAMKRAAVWVDDRLMFKSAPSYSEWKKAHHIDLSPELGPGFHEIRVAVENENGHPVLLASCEPLGLVTGEHWEASKDNVNWTPALFANSKQPVPLSMRFGRADEALFSRMDVFIPVFLLVFVFSLLWPKRDALPPFLSPICSARGIRWALLLAWIVLAVNNIGKLPVGMGMDWKGHIEYVRYVANYKRIPLATEGWQMFQPPLFYMLSAGIYVLFKGLFSSDALIRVLRILPFVCGAAQIELSYRALKYVYPKRGDLQALGTVVGGLLPMNIYISQFIGNEPMSGCVSATAVLLGFHFLRAAYLPSVIFFLFMGLVLGLAVLTKMSGVLLVPPLLLLVGYRLVVGTFALDKPLTVAAQRIILVLGVVFVVSGWYYLRNWIELGQIFIGGWDPSTGILWWQDPAYRIVQDFLVFGKSLFHPIYSSICGFWDSLYSTLWLDGSLSGMADYASRPPWNYSFVLSSTWLSLLPAWAILLGGLIAPWKSGRVGRQSLLFALSCTMVYIAAILYLYLTVPIYSTAKATYTLGLIPCYAALSAGGFDLLISKKLPRAIVFGLVACWAVASYLGYFVS